MIITAESTRILFRLEKEEHISPETFEWMKAIPEKRFLRASRTFVCANTPANARYLLNAPFTIPENIVAVMEDRLVNHAQAPKVKDIASTYPFITTPYEHQRTAFNFVVSSPHFALFMEMGTGKTKVAIDACDYFMEQDVIDYHFIVVPSNVLADRVWNDEYIKHSFLANDCEELGPGWEPTALMGSRKEREKLLYSDSSGPVFVINYEGFLSLEPILYRWFQRRAGRILFTLDESSNVKNPQAQRTKLALKLAPFAARRLILTGTPMSQWYLDLYGQFKFLSTDILGYATFSAFRTRYAVMGGFEGHQVVTWQNIAELRTQVRKWSYTVRKDDCLDLPPKVYETMRLDMAPEQKKVYKEMRDNFIVEIEEMGTITKSTINTVLTKLLRLHQITSGFLIMDDGSIKDFKSSKVEQCLELVRNFTGYGSKVVIQCVFQHEIARLVKLFNEKGIGAIPLDGSVPMKDRSEMLKRFRESPDVNVVVCQVRLASMGINLTAANYMIRFTQTYSLQDAMQMEDRVHRIGQTKNVTYVDLVCKGTVDVSVQAALRRKFDMAGFIMKQGYRGFNRFADGTVPEGAMDNHKLQGTAIKDALAQFMGGDHG